MIGLLRDEEHFGPDQEMMPSVFLPYPMAILTADRNDARGLHAMSIVQRGSIDPTMLVRPTREIARKLDRMSRCSTFRR